MNQKPSSRRSLAALLLFGVLFANTPLLQSEWLYAAPKSEVQVEAKKGTAVVNINKAGLEELQTVRGIGPSLAERVIQYREEHGRFERPEDLVNVRGIGEAKFQKIKSQISI